MPAGLEVLQLNCAYDDALADPAALLDRYHTLTGLSAALAAAGAHVHVVQRFGRDASVTRDGITYRFVSDGGAPLPPPSWAPHGVVDAVRAVSPDVVHVHGLMFPGMVAALRVALPDTVIVLQDHSGFAAPGRIQRLLDRSWRGLNDADAWSFTAIEHAEPWRAADLLRNARVIRVLEASTGFQPVARAEAAERTGVHAAPALLWVGRLNDNKDPLTVLAGLEIAFAGLPGARLWMIYGDAPLEAAVRSRVGRSPVLRERVVLLGHLPHDHLPAYYSAADIFVSGSRREGSGYALIEAMACGALPCVTDIPSFRAITGACGVRWRAGDARALAAALCDAATRDRDSVERQRMADWFNRELSWTAIGRQTLEAYRALVEARQRRTSRS